MHPDNDLPAMSSCTTCRFVEDKSNYWTAVMYFKHPNGSFIRVPQMANHNTGPGLQNGGMTVYYFQPRAPTKNLDIVAFRKGFRMIVGHPNRRSYDIDPNLTASKAVSLRCFVEELDLGAGTPGVGPEDSFDFPKKMCPGGIRSNIYFPQCWDGVNLDSEDHESHVAHPFGEPSAEGLQIFGTDCPDSHPVRLPLLFLEIVWDTRAFNKPELWPKDGSQPFVFSMGDPTGFGQHADYVFGWEGDSLQRAMEECTGGDGIPTNCPPLTVQDMDSMNNCRLPAVIPEAVEEQYLERLPGCNPLQYGPTSATLVEDCDAPATTTPAPASSAPPAIATPPWTVCHSGPGSEPLVPHCDSIPTATTSVAAPDPAMITQVPS
ncbi:hypothetical protein FA13DRAFT_664357 [Coprinellus micaceus]|uniref:DUF1996 domain-containing protein n=1 Tax=Coprinellus micaceus TaxID=71717 RepID=A0A4Y7T4Q6_COPMI|nr:hypothetical protein FA13DRAFT_664357 [Coprinellus micaceus]